MITSLIMTHDCNLRCSYCFAGKKRHDRMPIDIGMKAIDFVYNNFSDKELIINFFGGEPLLCYKDILALVEYAKSRLYKAFNGVKFSVTTNGTILNEDMVEFFIKNKFSFTLSLDGNEYSQNKCRRTINNNGSFELVKKNFPLWLKITQEKCLVTIRMTVDIENVDGMFNSIRDLINIGFTRFVFTPNVNDNWTEEAIVIYKNQFENIAKLYIECMENGTPFYCASIEKYIRRRLWNTIPGCSAAKNRISISPKGNIYPCHRFVGEDNNENIMIGNIFTGFNSFNDEFMRSYNKELGCASCDHVKRCGNVCPAVNYQLYKNINTKPWFTCECEQISIRIADNVWSQLFGKRNKVFMSYIF